MMPIAYCLDLLPWAVTTLVVARRISSISSLHDVHPSRSGHRWRHRGAGAGAPEFRYKISCLMYNNDCSM